jgi:Fur family transcriptional regulator, ferric uptake regulator
VSDRASAWVTETDVALQRAGFRRGGARRAVVDLLASQSCCLSAQEIHDRLRTDRTVGIASVYRVLDLLHGLKLVQRVDVGDGIARYEPVRGGGDHHHHVVCDDCGKVEAFHDDRLEEAIRYVGQRVDYDVGAHEVVLRGACGDCRVG